MPSLIEYTTDSDVYRYIRLCEGEGTTIPLDFSEFSVYWYALLVSPFPVPPWTYYYREDGSLLSIDFAPVTLPGGTDSESFDIKIIVFDNVPGEQSQLKLVHLVVTVEKECRPLYDTCGACGGVNIQWVNQTGGMQNYYFSGVREFDVSQDNAKKYIDPGKVNRYSTRGQVYKGEVVTTKAIPKTHVELLDSLRYAIQAWVNVDDRLYPIVIDSDSYVKYKSKDKFFDVSMRFLYADPVNIQSQ